ncbi:MAG: 3-hydroxyisobutyrate dehydrogenase-like beta-hydroxyacid dehydrogenase [Parvicella sp.]|jgi:3-hydroxyisobutyrate dehydrogenase-like beta-hydroxyacid dehydrogenase
MKKISVIGLGSMGSALANTLLQNGYAVTVWNRSIEKTKPLAAAGANVANSVDDAIATSPAIITCIVSHEQTIELFESRGDALAGKTIIELSTGGATEADELASLLSKHNAAWLIGIINAYPTAIGNPETVLTIVGEAEIWEQQQAAIKTLGGSSAHVGTEAGMLAALFAALFTTRQGFMFGMMYGALVCKKAGIPLDVFAKQVPVTMGVLPSYHQYFVDTVPEGQFDNPPATMTTYAAALDDVLSTFKATGAPDELPQLFSDLAHQGIDAGLQDKALTALVELLGAK